ncbi:Nitroreductase [Candidatus Sulfobium mesophilum]|uniref:Nitroreductase n=1 Tax=Candidatus Sulfobium mesophilum TaxID=2016548 RepID=A0A2U3QIT2_9BACT|nr:Nitroreductase [Candidatus Sulfobium mesophilum]
MDILETIKSRRSIRKFENVQVPEELLEKILEAGRWAPSGLNNQPWRFAVISDVSIREMFSQLTHYSRIVASSQILIAVFLDTAVSYDRTKDVQAVGACIQNMLLEAHALGLGGVWLGEILRSSEQINKILGLSNNLELMAVIALGYPAESPKNSQRKELKNLVIFRK